MNLRGLILAAREGLRTVNGIKQGSLAVFLPRNSNKRQIKAAIPPGIFWEIWEHWVDGRQKGLTVYVHF